MQLRRRRQRRRLVLGIVTDHGEGATELADADPVRLADRVARPVETGCLAVPHAEHAVVLAGADHVRDLRAPDRRGAELFVQPGDEPHVELVEDRPLLADHRVEAADRRTGVARDQPGGAQPGAPVGAALVDDRAHDRVHPADRDVAPISREAVAQVERCDRHCASLSGTCPTPPFCLLQTARGLI